MVSAYLAGKLILYSIVIFCARCFVVFFFHFSADLFIQVNINSARGAGIFFRSSLLWMAKVKIAAEVRGDQIAEWLSS